jgi:hypothetical protein
MQRKTTFLFAGGLGVVLVGCSVLAQQPKAAGYVQTLQPVVIEGVPKPTQYPTDRYSAAICAQERCTITVRVDPQCRISIDPQWIAVSRKFREVVLVFEMRDSPGFSFPKNATPWKPRPGETQSPFGDSTLLRDGTIHEIVFRNTPNPPRDYAINVARGAEVCGTLDPPVMPDF